jgi:meckelin
MINFLYFLVLRKILKIWFPTKPEEFVDLCTIANISIFILDEINHGYYIHGKTPGGIAEGIYFFFK